MAKRATKRKRRALKAKQLGVALRPPPFEHKRHLTIRDRVFIRDDYTCVYCGQPGTTLDHVIPKSKGGPSSFRNLVCCCKRCNAAKKDLDVEVFRVWIKLSAAVA